MLDEIMEAIQKARSKNYGEHETLIVYNSRDLPILREVVERAIREHTEKDIEREKEMAILSAKVYAYEAIIRNSNFSPILCHQKDDVSVLEEGRQEWE